MSRILVASDLSARSSRALARSIALAKDLGSTLDILHVVDADLPQEFRTHSIQWARQALSRETEGISKGVKVSIEVCAGYPSSEIATRADALNVGLIVLGVHNRTAAPGKPFAETTAGKTSSASRAPVLLVNGETTQPYRRVVIGVSFSSLSRAVFRQALRIAPGGRFYLVHAFQAPFEALTADSDLASEIGDSLNDQMELIAKWAQGVGITADALEKILREGEPRRMLGEECAKIGADLLVIGTHAARNARAVWGSTAASLLHEPPCDVLIAKPHSP